MDKRTDESHHTGGHDGSGFLTPPPERPTFYTDPAEAVAALRALYERNTAFIRDAFAEMTDKGDLEARVRAYYPQLSVKTASYNQVA